MGKLELHSFRRTFSIQFKCTSVDDIRHLLVSNVCWTVTFLCYRLINASSPKLFRRRGRTRRFYFSVHYITLYNQLILLEFLLLYFQVSCYLVAFKIAAVEKTCSHHDWLHLDCCIKFNHSMGIVFSIGAIVSRLGYNAMSWGVATRTRWFHVFSHCKCVCMLFSSNVVDITLLHSDLDKSLQALHSGRFKRCTNGSDATKIQDQSR